MMNNHLDPDLLSAYLDGEVTPAERARVEAHLSTCGGCRQELESLRWTVGLLRRMPPVDLPRTFYLRETDVTPEAAPRRSRLLTWLQPLLAFSTAVSAVLFVIFLLGSLNLGSPALAPAPAAQLARAPEAAAPVPTAAVEKPLSIESAPAPPTEHPAPLALQPTPAPTVAAAAAEAPASEAPAGGLPLATPEADTGVGAAAVEESATATPGRELRGAAEATVEAETEAGARTAAEPTRVPQLPSEAEGLAPPPPAGPQPPALAAFFGLVTLLFGGITLWLRRRR